MENDAFKNFVSLTRLNKDVMGNVAMTPFVVFLIFYCTMPNNMAYYGNYNLEKFNTDTADRLLFICKKANA